MNADERRIIRPLMIVATVLMTLMVGAMFWVALTNPGGATRSQSTTSEAPGP